MTIAQAVLDMMTETKEATSPLRSYSDAERETLYSSGYHFYAQGSFEKASDLFLQLILCEPYEENYWRGLASSYQMQSKWDEALHAWALCALLKEEDPLPHYHAAECLFSKKEKEETQKALRQAKLRCKDDALLSKIQLLEELCSERQGLC